jgi:hypothetical protein
MGFQIICKKRVTLIQWQEFKAINGDKLARPLATVNVLPSLKPQTIPDWCIDSDDLQMGIVDGAIILVGNPPERKAIAQGVEMQPEVIPETNKPVEQPTQSTQEQDEEILAILNKPLSELTGGAAPAQWPTRPDGFPRPNDAKGL